MASEDAPSNDAPVDFLINPLRGTPEDLISGGTSATAFHRKLPGYAPTALIDSARLADRLGVDHVLVKVESARFGLPAFKLLGASWATYRLLTAKLGYEPEWSTIEDLAAAIDSLRPLRLATATDGNHGRAVARMAEMLGLECTIFVPKGTSAARTDAIASHGADVIVVDGHYDDAVRQAVEFADSGDSGRTLVVSDTSWPGYVDPPRNVIGGYTTLFAEFEAQRSAAGFPAPTHWFIPAGVGALLAAAVTAAHETSAAPPLVICVEPADADCLLESARAGHLVEVPGPHRSQMVGLNCGSGSPEAWPSISTGTDAFIAIPDRYAEDSLRTLDATGIQAGETGSAALAGALALLDTGLAERVRIGADSVLAILVTEGVTDPENWARITGHSPG